MKIKFRDVQGELQTWEVQGFPVLIRQGKTKILHLTPTENSFPEPWTEKTFISPEGTQLRIVFSNAPALQRAQEELAPFSGLILLSYQTNRFRLEIEC